MNMAETLITVYIDRAG